jgi:hypothetical protein
VNLLTLGHDYMEHLTSYMVDGQVDMDATQPVTRQLTMTLMDPADHLPFDTDSPNSTALFMDRMLQVKYRVIVNGSWVSVPVFTGPVTGLQRAGSQVNVTCQSKEVLAMGSVWPPMTIHKNVRKTSALTTILHAAGEEDKHMKIPDLNNRLPHPISLFRSQQYWPSALGIADALNRQLYYDGAGDCRLRTPPGHHFTFTSESHVIGDPQITYGAVTANTVMIVGGKPKGAKNPIISIQVAPNNHPLSPWRLGRNGVPRHILLTGQPISMPHIKTQKEADDVAKHKLNVALMQQVDVQFDVMPGALALLDHGDFCRVNTKHGVVPFRLLKYSLPLGTGETASVGYHRNVSVARTHRWNQRPRHRPKSRRHHR